jgi:hypothetical protein
MRLSGRAAASQIPANADAVREETFVGFDGKRYSARPSLKGGCGHEVRHDGRFWHVTFPIASEPGGQQVYRGRHLPTATDHDRWVRYLPFPQWTRGPSVA